MTYSTLYENQARERMGINPYEELRVVLASFNGRSDIYVIAVPANYQLPKIPIVDKVDMGDCIDVIIQGEVNARGVAEGAAEKGKQSVGMTKYEGQTAVKLQSELDVAKLLAEQRQKNSFCYSDLKKIA